MNLKELLGRSKHFLRKRFIRLTLSSSSQETQPLVDDLRTCSAKHLHSAIDFVREAMNFVQAAPDTRMPEVTVHLRKVCKLLESIMENPDLPPVLLENVVDLLAPALRRGEPAAVLVLGSTVKFPDDIAGRTRKFPNAVAERIVDIFNATMPSRLGERFPPHADDFWDRATVVLKNIASNPDCHPAIVHKVISVVGGLAVSHLDDAVNALEEMWETIHKDPRVHVHMADVLIQVARAPLAEIPIQSSFVERTISLLQRVIKTCPQEAFRQVHEMVDRLICPRMPVMRPAYEALIENPSCPPDLRLMLRTRLNPPLAKSL